VPGPLTHSRVPTTQTIFWLWTLGQRRREDSFNIHVLSDCRFWLDHTRHHRLLPRIYRHA